MNEPEVLESIRSAGHWRVLIRPTRFEGELFPSLSEAWKSVDKAVIRLRGWDYPHIDDPNRINQGDRIESWVDWQDHREFWRVYLSGQFLHYIAMFEDYREVPGQSSEYPGTGKPSKYLEITSTLLRITEITEFARRLYEGHEKIAGVQFSIRLLDTEGRDLVYWTLDRFLRRRYRCKLPQVEANHTASMAELLAEADKVALRLSVRLFELFNWINPPVEFLEEDQKRLLERRL
jgi:hypothetical protein